ncbi:MAG: thiamine phosphate synthase [Gammaproteobacteria bacterium]|nr:thiamine phosphate synthase [Gammaproteobacteria bacterium]
MRGLYAITDDRLTAGEQLLPKVEQALLGGARLIQYRNKTLSPVVGARRAVPLLALCRRYGVPLIINDDLELALTIGADGVHLGRDDGDLHAARARLQPGGILGVSCYNDWANAVAAVRAGADYVAFGAFFPSATKPQAARATPDLIRRAKQELTIPVVAIGGITPDNGAALIDAGADMLAVITAVFDQDDVTGAARQFGKLFEDLKSNAEAQRRKERQKR